MTFSLLAWYTSVYQGGTREVRGIGNFDLVELFEEIAVMSSNSKLLLLIVILVVGSAKLCLQTISVSIESYKQEHSCDLAIASHVTCTKGDSREVSKQ